MKKLPFGIVSIVLLSLAPFMPSARAQADNQSTVGTWIVTVTLTSPSAPPFTDSIAFNQGGTLTAASSAFNAHTSENPILQTALPALVVDTSDGYGVWKSAGDDSGEVAITFQRFLFAGAATSSSYYSFSFPGQYVGVNTVQAVGTLQDADHLAGSFTTEFVNLGGHMTFFGKGTFTATRLKIEPLLTTP